MAVKDLAWGTLFLIIICAILFFNILFWVVFCRRKRLKNTGHFTLLFALSLVDVIFGGTWTTLSAIASIIDWELPGEVCRLQSFLLTFTQSATAFLLATISLERLLRMLKPSRHLAVFVPKVTLFAICGLFVFCGVISSIHLYGTVTTSWHSKEHQCGADFTESIRLLNMTFCFDHAIPYYVIALPAFIGAFVKIFIAQRNPSKYGEIVLERNNYAPSDSYSARLSKLQSKFRAGTSKFDGKGKKATLGQRVYSSKGYTEAEHWDSDIGDEIDAKDKNKKLEDSRQRLHSLSRSEYSMLVMSITVTIVTVIFWFPWIVTRFVWNKTPRETVPDGIANIAIFCMHAAAFVKPIVYFITNAFFRSAVTKTFFGRSSKGGKEETNVTSVDSQEESHTQGEDNLGFAESG